MCDSILIKISMHGSFAHLNILKNPITPLNLEDALGFAMKQSPEEILNIFEYYSDVQISKCVYTNFKFAKNILYLVPMYNIR